MAVQRRQLDPSVARAQSLSPPAGHGELYAPLDRSDVSYEKIVELERRLIAATRAGTVAWDRNGRDYEWATPKGVVDVSPVGVSIYDASGNRLRRFSYPTNDLYAAVAAWYDEKAADAIDRILADLATL